MITHKLLLANVSMSSYPLFFKVIGRHESQENRMKFVKQ